MLIGYTSGIFDLFHQGHINYLTECKKYCDFLFVGVDSDQRTALSKGVGRPIENINSRLKKVSEFCDISFEKKESSWVYIEKIRPKILFRSAQNPILVQKENVKIIYIPYTLDISTTILISKLNVN